MRILRDRMLKAFQEFEEGKIDFTHLAALSKASDSIINGLKSEMQYAILTNQQPQIPFYGEGSGISLDKKDIKKLL
jgi:hypothetical protein